MNNCRKCKLNKYRRTIVEGSGDIPADILIIGEAPGKTEDMLGIPFSGLAGQLLKSMLKEVSIRLNIKPKIHFLNTVLCRPTDKIGGENRQPRTEEIFACHNQIIKMIIKVNPKYIIFAGDIAEKSFNKDFPHGIKILHPSAILRLGGRSSGYYFDTMRKIESIFKKYYYY